MPFHLNNTDLTNWHLGSQQLAKIRLGATILWENWKQKSGNFYIMTSNTKPTGFTASTTMKNDATLADAVAYYAFNNNTSNNCGTGNANLGHEVKLLFPKAIKIKEITWSIGASHNQSQVGTKNLTWGIFGIKEDNSEVLLFEKTTNSSSDSTVYVQPISDDNEYKGIHYKKTDSLGWGTIQVRMIQVTKWLEKGGN